MLRVPSLREIADLFFTPSSVDGAVAMLDRAKLRVAKVAERCQSLADAATRRQLDAEAAALRHSETADTHTAEAGRAARVHQRLADMLA